MFIASPVETTSIPPRLERRSARGRGIHHCPLGSRPSRQLASHRRLGVLLPPKLRLGGVAEDVNGHALRALVGQENLEERWDGTGDTIDSITVEYLQNRLG